MPYLKIETNKSEDDSVIPGLLKKTSVFISNLLGKPEEYIMVSIENETGMMFGGSIKPAAYIELKSIGLPREKCPMYAEKICEFMESELAIPPDRIYIDFCDLERKMFGWNKSTF